MMGENLEKRAEESLQQDLFRRSAFLIIAKIIDLRPKPPSVLVDECLHSIFFAGMIHKPRYEPKDIVSDAKMLAALENCYSRPFELCFTQLPKRSPFSCVLDMFVHQVRVEGNREEEEHRVREQLQTFIKELRKGGAKKMISAAICVSQKLDSSSDRYYGVSMSTFDCPHGQIMIAASCLHTWDSYVADAVMTYCPEKEKKAYFDGTLQLQELIRCETFSLGRGEHMDPCRSCGNLFGLTTGSVKVWPYGHCAEAESISNLLKSQNDLRQRATPKFKNYTVGNRQSAKDSVSKHLKDLLRNTVFEAWDFGFYTPTEN
ncbi:uncharacterized protein LOC141803134 isoform X1 [Halichoeres trimaculatus]|uniref:uncharacterized protein LOC141803134 isoform X1 n=1 Tax=Halichoeres trimaculatus TaxID=147232 RepID=UPI003D9E2B59